MWAGRVRVSFDTAIGPSTHPLALGHVPKKGLRCAALGLHDSPRPLRFERDATLSELTSALGSCSIVAHLDLRGSPTRYCARPPMVSTPFIVPFCPLETNLRALWPCMGALKPGARIMEPPVVAGKCRL